MTHSSARRVAFVVVVAAAVGGFVGIILWPRPDIVPVEVISGNDPCPAVFLRGQAAELFFRDRLARQVSALGMEPEREQKMLEYVSHYLAASVAACGVDVAALRSPRGYNGRLLGIARRMAESVQIDLRPDPAALGSDKEIAKWFISYAEPWAWIDAKSIGLSSRSWQEFRVEITEYYARARARREEASAQGPSLYESVFGAAKVSEGWRGSTRLARLSLTFGLREGSYTIGPSLDLVIYFVLDDDNPQVLVILLEGNFSGLWRNLAL